MTVTSTSGTFTRGERITDPIICSSSGLSITWCNLNSVHYHMFFKVMVQQTLQITVGETITGRNSSGATATVGTLTACVICS